MAKVASSRRAGLLVLLPLLALLGCKKLATITVQSKDVTDYVAERIDFDQLKARWKTAYIGK
jgi:hypothetical protein